MTRRQRHHHRLGRQVVPGEILGFPVGRFPDVEVVLTEENTANLLALFRTRRLDAAFLRPADGQGGERHGLPRGQGMTRRQRHHHRLGRQVVPGEMSIRDYRAAFPDVEVVLTEENTANLLALFRTRRLDAAFLRPSRTG
jgi:hypothetical protein